MKKRVITSVVYVIVFLAMIALKWLVPAGWGAIGFDALFCVVSIIGCIELLNALNCTSLPQRAVTIAFCAVIVPLYAFTEITTGEGWLAALICAALYSIILTVLHFTRFDGSTGDGTAASFFAMGYCGVLCCTLTAANHFWYESTAAMLLLFLSVVLTDVCAFLIGTGLKRWIPYKLAPSISPNKTVIGGAGGILGGIIGAILAYFLYYGLNFIPELLEAKKLEQEIAFVVDTKILVAFILIGFIISIFGQAGDLFESAIKRRCNIKDMGKCLPGHGGILDRFDSMLFCGIVIILGFVLLSF